MDQAERIRLLRGMGKAAGVFMALAWFGSAGEVAISNMLGINQETARLHLRKLEGLGLCKRNAHFKGYELSETGLEFLGDKRGNSAFDPSKRGKSAHERGNSAFDPLTTTTTKLTLSKDIEVVVEAPASAENPRMNAEIPRIEESPELQAKWEALTAAGIGRNSRTARLVAMDHVTPDFIRAHAAALHGKNGSGKGILILRLENNEPVPEVEPKRSYSDWEVMAGDYKDTQVDCQDPEPEIPQGQAQDIWRMALQALELQMPKAQFEAYIRPITAMAYECGRLTLQASSGDACAWLDSRIKRTLENILPGITGDDVAVEFTHLSTVENQAV